MKRILIKTTILLLVAAILISQSVFAATPKALSDIKGNWAEAEIQKLFAKGIITGNDLGKYEPAKSITRAEFTALLTRAMGLKGREGSSFYDPGYNGYWARPYIETAVAEGIIVPSEAGENFFGNVPLKRSDMAVMMARALKLTPSEAQVNPYIDITEPNGYITKLYEEYLMRGYTENGKQLFKTNNQTTKAEAATVVSRILEYKTNPVGFVANAAMEERFKNGTQTQEDIAAKIDIEKEKQAQSSTYIMEPVLTVEYNSNPGVYYYFEIFFENKRDYSDECQYKLECINYPQLNVIDMAMMNGTYKRYDLSSWRPLGSEYKNIRNSIYSLSSDYYTTQENIKSFKILPGMKLDFRFTLVRGTETRIINKSIVVNDIHFK